MSDDHAVRWADELDRVLSEEAADECQRFALAHGVARFVDAATDPAARGADPA